MAQIEKQDQATTVKQSRLKLMLKGFVAMLPLSIAIIPWGILAGSLAVDAGLVDFQAQSVSLFVFAGSVQLVTMALVSTGASITVILVTTLFLTSRHLLYSASMRGHIKTLPLPQRLILGFLLTDELFAIVGQQRVKEFSFYYAFGAGFSFYLFWQLSSLAGVVLGQNIEGLNQYGLDFAVVAMFIAIVVPQIKKISTLVATLSALVLSVWFSSLNIQGAIVIAGLIAMLLAYITAVVLKEEG